jgi:hypothetical protein
MGGQKQCPCPKRLNREVYKHRAGTGGGELAGIVESSQDLLWNLPHRKLGRTEM